MRLIRLHIENFGKLSDFDMDFSDNLNTVLHENGWGKSTLAAFIRTMFYGLEGGRKRGLSENDRMKYMPWNKGHFGGSVEFEASGKRYVVTRDFGSRDKDATFRLQDAETLLDSHDYTDRLGEEIFGIDSESFGKTSFIDHSTIRYEGINSTIGSKVGSLSQRDDLNNYDLAEEQMKNYLNTNSARKKTGELYKLNEEIKRLERNVENQGAILARIDGLQKKRQQEKERLSATRKEQETLQKEQKKLAESRARALHFKRKKELEAEVQSRRIAVKAREESFGGRIPSWEELRNLNAKVEEAEKQNVRLASFSQRTESERLERLKRYFRNGIPTEREVLEQIEKCNAVQDAIQRKQHLEEQAAREKRKLEEYGLERQRIEVADGLQAASARKAQSTRQIVSVTLLSLGILFAALCLMMDWNKLFLIPAVLLALSGAALLLMHLTHSSVRKGSAGAGNASSGEAELICRQENACQENLALLKEEMQSLESASREKEESIRGFLEEREISYSRADAESILYEMKNRVAEYRELLQEEEDKKLQQEALQRQARSLEEALKAALDEMGIQAAPADYPGMKKVLEEKSQNLTRYENDLKEQKTSESAWQAFCEEHPDLQSEEGTAPSEAEVQEREQEIDVRFNQLAQEGELAQEAVSAYNRELENAYIEAEELREQQEKLEAWKEQWERESRQYQLVAKTQEYLKRAKERFTARFMRPIKTAFDKYYEMMTNGAGSGEEYQIDANLNIARKEAGAFHDVEAQSDGYADMIGLCIRTALLDAMYEKEKPVVIMDDPFVSLDQNNLQGAKHFLERLSKEYQVIYLTCHEDRA